MKKHLTIILVFVLAVSNAAFAQVTLSLNLWGPQFSGFTKDVGVYKEFGNQKYNEESLTGILAGLSVRIPLKKRSYVTTEVLYSIRGATRRYRTGFLDGYSVQSFNGDENTIEYFLDYRMNYIEVPVLYTLNLSSTEESRTRFYFSTGLSTGFNVVSKLKQNDFSVSAPFSTFSSIDVEIKESQVKANPVILNLVSELDFEFHRYLRETKYFIYGRFNHSLTRVFPKNESGMETKMFTYGFGFGLRWNIRS